MSQGEQDLLKYAKSVLGNENSPLVLENIAFTYRALLFRSRAFEIEDIERLLQLLETCGEPKRLTPEAQKAIREAPMIAFAALLGQDHVHALAILEKFHPHEAIEADNTLQFLLQQAKRTLASEPTLLYALWNFLTVGLPRGILKTSSGAWIDLACDYCRFLLQSGRLTAFTVWLQAQQWHAEFPSAAGGASLLSAASVLMSPQERSFYRANQALWDFVRAQNEARSLPEEEGRRARLFSLIAALEMIEAELPFSKQQEAEIREVWQEARPWMTEDLPSTSSWLLVEKQIRSLTEGRDRSPSIMAEIAEDVQHVFQAWFEQNLSATEAAIQIVAAPPAWTDRPLFAGDWRDIEHPDEIRRRLAPIVVPGRVLHGRSGAIERVRELHPSFYPGRTLVEVQARFDDRSGGICTVALSGADQSAVFNGESSAIHQLNQFGWLKGMDDPKTVLAYVQFFCATVWGDSGPFRVVESIADLPLMDSPPAGLLQLAGEYLRKRPSRIRPGSEGNWEVTLLICYEMSLSQAILKVTRAGVVEMISDERLIKRLPIRRIVMRDDFRFFEGAWTESPSLQADY
jgi:hypothetical protein